MPPFRFGVQGPRVQSGEQLRERARRVESLGYSTLFVPDHLADRLSPLVSLTVAAEATETLRVGTLVMSNDYRHPVIAARELATLDFVSGGRLEVGLGAGWLRTDYEQLGMQFDPPGIRVSRLQESVAIMKQMWSEGSATLQGEHYGVNEAVGYPAPERKPHPTLIIGGGSKRVLSFAAREADIVGVNVSLKAGAIGPEVAETISPAHFHERVGWIKEAAGKRFDSLELQCLPFLCMVVPNREEMAELMAPTFGVSASEALASPYILAGTTEQIVDDLLARREEYGFSYWVVQDDVADDFAPVVEKLSGG